MSWHKKLPPNYLNDKTTGMGFKPSWASYILGLNALEHNKTVYTYSQDGYTEKSLDNLKDDLSNLGLTAFFRENDGGNDFFLRFHNSESFLEINLISDDKWFYVTLCTHSEELYTKVLEYVKSIKIPKKSKGRVYVLVQESNEFSLKSMGIAALPLEAGNYDPEVIKQYNHIVADLKNPSPCGRLSIFDGVAGAGKTFIVRSILHDVPDAMFIVLPVNLIQSITHPSMISVLMNLRSSKSKVTSIFLLEDADECLAPRASDNIGSISNLLNLSDGIIGAMTDIRVICTTNAKQKDMDSAILRPGRLCKRVNVPPLKPEQASQIYTRLTQKTKEFSKNVTLAEVYRLAIDEGWVAKSPEPEIGFSSNYKTYDLDDDGDLVEIGIADNEWEAD